MNARAHHEEGDPAARRPAPREPGTADSQARRHLPAGAHPQDRATARRAGIEPEELLQHRLQPPRRVGLVLRGAVNATANAVDCVAGALMRGDAGKARLPLPWTAGRGRHRLAPAGPIAILRGAARDSAAGRVSPGRSFMAASHPGERASLGQGGMARLPLPGVAGRWASLSPCGCLSLGREAAAARRGRKTGRGGQGPCMRTGRYVAFASVLAALVAAAPAEAVLAPHIAGAQVALRAEGLYRGPIDGIAGPQTKRAVRAFQRREGIAVDGVDRPADAVALRPARAAAAWGRGTSGAAWSAGTSPSSSSSSTVAGSGSEGSTGSTAGRRSRRCAASRAEPRSPRTGSSARRRRGPSRAGRRSRSAAADGPGASRAEVRAMLGYWARRYGVSPRARARRRVDGVRASTGT